MLKRIIILMLFLSSYAYGQPEVWLNIFVHGIVKTPFSIGDFRKIVQNSIENSQHYHMVNYLRERPEYFLHQPMQKKGLVKIDFRNINRCNGLAALAKLYDYQERSLSVHRVNQFNKKKIFNQYYTFGWSGYLSRAHREADAKKLLKALQEEVNVLKKQGITPRIRLIGFSHGANVILNLAKHAGRNTQFRIDEAIFLAIPIHKESDIYINSPIFKKIYSFYSVSDIAQKADFFSTEHMSSRRRFARRCLHVPKKLTQVQLRVTNITFNKYGKIDKQYHIDPNHMEFWTFGWIEKNYRAKFPLSPFSIVSLVPTLTNTIESINSSNDIVLDVIPKLDKIVITDKCTKKEYNLPFISHYDLNQMKKICSCFRSYANKCVYDKASLIRCAMSYALCKRAHAKCVNCRVIC